MRFEKYNIVFSRLILEDIELVRNWRNSPEVSQFMEYREYITPEMQRKWFDSINNNRNYFFIASYEGEKFSVVNIKNIDYEKKCAEGGIFIGNTKYLNSTISFRTSLGILNFYFYELKMDFLYAHVLKTNKRAIRYNKFFGFILEVEQENKENQLYSLTKENYGKNRKIIQKMLGLKD